MLILLFDNEVVVKQTPYVVGQSIEKLVKSSPHSGYDKAFSNSVSVLALPHRSAGCMLESTESHANWDERTVQVIILMYMFSCV